MTRTDPGSGSVGAPPDETVDEGTVTPLVPAEIMAQSLPDYFRALWLRLKSGESGVLPVILSTVIVFIVFWWVSPNHVFISAGNMINLFQQSAVFMVLAMAEMFALLLGEIDLSLGFLGAVGGTIAVQLTEPGNAGLPWWLAIIIALVATALAGIAQGLIITLLRIPSFIVTLAGYLIWNGVLLIVLAYGPYSGYPSLNGIQSNLRYLRNLMNGSVTPLASWISMIVIVGLYGALMFFRDERRRRTGLEAPPFSLTLLKIGLLAATGVVLVVICNLNRGTHVHKIQGVPYFIYIVLGVLAMWTFLLARTRYGRYVYAIGGNAEAARRAGINVTLIRTVAFGLAGFTAGIAMTLYASYIGGMSNNVNGGQLVLYAVAAAVIGGTSLFGGRGKMGNSVLGGLLIGAIYNGLYLIGLEAQWQYIITGCVLLFAVTIDALARRGASSGSATRI
jgi:ABC-type xylose transport system permease subunit